MIGDSIQSHPENLIATVAEARKKLRTGRYAFTIVSVVAAVATHILALK